MCPPWVFSFAHAKLYQSSKISSVQEVSRVSLFSIRDSRHERVFSRNENLSVIKSDTNSERKDEWAPNTWTTFSSKGRRHISAVRMGHTPRRQAPPFPRHIRDFRRLSEPDVQNGQRGPLGSTRHGLSLEQGWTRGLRCALLSLLSRDDQEASRFIP